VTDNRPGCAVSAAAGCAAGRLRVVTDNLFIGHAPRMDVRASDFLSFGERDDVFCRAAAIVTGAVFCVPVA